MELRVRVGCVLRILFLIAVVTSLRSPQQIVRRSTSSMRLSVDDVSVANLMNIVQEKLAARLQTQEMNAARLQARDPIVVDPNNVFNQMFSQLTSFKIDIDINPAASMEQFIHNNEKLINTAFLEQIITTLQASELGPFLGYSVSAVALTATVGVVGLLMSRNAIDDLDDEVNNTFGEVRIDASSLPEGSPYGEPGTYNAYNTSNASSPNISPPHPPTSSLPPHPLTSTLTSLPPSSPPQAPTTQNWPRHIFQNVHSKWHHEDWKLPHPPRSLGCYCCLISSPVS